MGADIPQGRRAQERVDDGMENGIGVRMALESFGRGDTHSAQNERSAPGVTMAVVAHPTRIMALSVDGIIEGPPVGSL